MSWTDLKTAMGDLGRAADAGEPLDAPWARFLEVARAPGAGEPYHLVVLLDRLRQVTGDRPRAEVAILDHGCGNGLTLLYLAAHGWTNVHGVDLGGPAPRWNRLLRDVLGVAGDRFHHYDGVTLPLADDSIDLVFSQQVVEHVAPDVYESYFGEERRVLKPGGVAYHQVPHRLVPYESHTRTWLLHYLPAPLFHGALEALKRANAVSREGLHLRWPWRLRRDLGRIFGEVTDATTARLMTVRIGDYYDGPARLRRLMQAVTGLPVVGGLARGMLANLVMIDLVAVKRPRR